MRFQDLFQLARRSLLFCFAVVLCPTLMAQPPAGDGWVDLFNGKNLDGWVQRGGKANFRVEDGQIVGSTVPNTPNSFLCTTREFQDFILELDFMVHPELNSGVQIRSAAHEAEVTEDWYGQPRRIDAGRVHGLQVEIDPSPRAYTGGLYAEAAAGWLVKLDENPQAQKAFRQNDWNHFRIEASGEMIRTWLNGVPAAQHKVDKVRSGFIALQVHSVGKREEPLEVRFRNIRLKPLP